MRSAGTEAEDHFDSDQKALGVMGLVQRDTSLFLRDLRLGASSWLNSFLELSGRKPQKTTSPTAGELELSPKHLAKTAQTDTLTATERLVLSLVLQQALSFPQQTTSWKFCCFPRQCHNSRNCLKKNQKKVTLRKILVK